MMPRTALRLILAVAAAACAAAAVRAGDPRAASQGPPSVAQPRPYDDMWPAWSPDGARVAFMSTRDGDPEIYVMNRDGSAARRLTTTPGRDAHPFWSPDGTRIVFQSPREEGQTRLFVMNADGSGQRALTANRGFCGVPAWSPDGRHIAFQCSDDAVPPIDAPWHLFVIDADGGEPRQLTRGAWNHQVPNWSPDGRRLVFSSDRSGTEQLYVMDLPSAEPVALTTGPGTSSAATWSSDGTHVIFMSDRHGGAPDIYRIDLAGGGLRRLTQLGLGPGLPWYSPDGSAILFQRRVDDAWRIWMTEPDGSNPRPIAAAQGAALGGPY